MEHSKNDAAIAAFLAAYRDNGAADVAAVVAEAKRALGARKGMQGSLYAGFLQLAAQGLDPMAVRATGAKVRQSVTAVMRTQAGFPAVKPKGAKESGAPDFSTASVYAGVVADMLSAQRDAPTEWAQAVADINGATETPPAVHEASGLFESVSAGKRTLSRYAELVAARMEHEYPALAHQDPSAVGARTVEELERENAALRKHVTELLQPGDAGVSLKEARAERDAAQAEAIALQAKVSEATAAAAAAIAEAQSLREALAEASSATAA